MKGWWDSNVMQPLWKATQSFLKKLKAEEPYDPVTPLLDTQPEESKRGNTRTTVFTALFTTAEIWNLDAPRQMDG